MPLDVLQDSSMFLLYKFIRHKLAALNAHRLQMSQMTNAMQRQESGFRKAQQQLRRLVENEWFSRVFMGLILINTVALVRFIGSHDV